MNLRQIEIFCAVMRSRTLVAASHELGVSQPAVSNAIKHLEAQLGMPLFERIANRLRPTSEAQALYRDAETLEAMSQMLSRRIADLRHTRRGTLRILATQALARSIVAPAIARFTPRGRDVEVYFDVRRMEGVVESIEVGLTDFGFAVAPSPRPGMEIEPLVRGRMVVALPPNHALAKLDLLTPDDLYGERLIGLETSSRLGGFVRQAFDRQGTPYRPEFEVRHCVSALMLTEQGVGVAVVDEFSADACANWRVELRPFEPETTVVACIMYQKSRPMSRLATRFLHHVRRIGAQNAGGALPAPSA